MATIDIDAEDMVIIGGCSDGEEDAIAVQSRVAGLETVVKSRLEVGMRRSRRSIGGQPIPLGLLKPLQSAIHWAHLVIRIL